MPISFGRRKGAESGEPDGSAAAVGATAPVEPAPLNAGLLRDLEHAAHRHVTGALELVERAHGARARVYLYEGGVYAVAIEGYRPDVTQRLLATGVLDEGRADYLAGVDRPGPTAARQGWIGVDALATVHQEYLLASLGAVLACGRVKAHLRKGDVTDELCTLPLPVEPMLEAVRVRAQRLTGTWAATSPEGTPDTVVVRQTGAALPASLALPEFAAFRSAVDGQRTVDAVAEQVGLTRAEAVHLVSLLVTAGVVTLAHDPAATAPADRFRVPEAFGAHAVRTGGAPAKPAVPVVLPVPEPEPEPVPEPEPLLEPVPEPEPEPEPEQEPEPEPEREPEPEPEPEPEREPVAPSVDASGDEHVRLLRRELLISEVAELREAFDEAVVAEREAIAQAAAIRARLREAEAALEELGGEA
jgi:outer membrane biosynthesis protein TonB